MVSGNVLGSPVRRVLVALLIVAAVLVPAAHAQAAEDVLIVEGGGWGHSVGMAQYGARGQALEGRSWSRILTHYYQDVRIGTVGAEVPHPGHIWVGLEQDRTEVTFTARAISSPSAPVVFQQSGGGSVSISADQWAKVTFNSNTSCTVSTSTNESTTGSCTIDATWDGWEASPSTYLELGNFRYARGTMHIRPNAAPSTNQIPSGFHVSVELELEKYVWGVKEMPYSWEMEALKAQAGAARSYAVNRMATRGHPASSDTWQRICWCHVRDSVHDQVYVGWGIGAGGDRWVNSSKATAGKVLIHDALKDGGGNHIAVPAFYSSSTFGKTEDNTVGFGSKVKAPYLGTVNDAWSVDPKVSNPYATWRREIPLSEAASRLGMSSVSGASISSWSPSGAAKEVTFTGSSGSKTFKTSTLRSLLGLRSGQITSVKIGLASGGTVAGAGMRGDSVALQDPRTGVWHVLYTDGKVRSFYYGDPADVPFAGNWDCNSGDTVGLYRRSSGFLYLRHSNSQGIGDVRIFYGVPEDMPLSGDWNGNGCTTVGIYRPSEATFYLRNTNTQGFADLTIRFGNFGDVPLAGDWNGDGTDTIGVFRPSNKTLYLSNSNTNPRADIVWTYSGWMPGDRIVVGDWNGDGTDSVGVFRTSEARFYLRDTLTQPAANYVFYFGEPHMLPATGDWRR